MDETKLRYAKSHEWVQVDGSTCVVGITRFAVEQLTDIVYVELPAVGASVAAGAPFGVIESVKAVSDLYAPVAGTVAAVNQKVVDDPAILSDDPFERGWMIKIEVGGVPDLGHLLDKTKYDELVASEAH